MPSASISSVIPCPPARHWYPPGLRFQPYPSVHTPLRLMSSSAHSSCSSRSLASRFSISGCRDAMARSRGVIKIDFVPRGTIDFILGGAIELGLTGVSVSGMKEAFGMAEVFDTAVVFDTIDGFATTDVLLCVCEIADGKVSLRSSVEDGTLVFAGDFGATVFGAVAILARDLFCLCGISVRDCKSPSSIFLWRMLLWPSLAKSLAWWLIENRR